MLARLLSTFVKPKCISVEYQVLFYAFAFPSMECISVPPGFESLPVLIPRVSNMLCSTPFSPGDLQLALNSFLFSNSSFSGICRRRRMAESAELHKM